MYGYVNHISINGTFANKSLDVVKKRMKKWYLQSEGQGGFSKMVVFA